MSLESLLQHIIFSELQAEESRRLLREGRRDTLGALHGAFVFSSWGLGAEGNLQISGPSREGSLLSTPGGRARQLKADVSQGTDMGPLGRLIYSRVEFVLQSGRK